MDKPVPPQAASPLLAACAIRNWPCTFSPNCPWCLSRHQDFLSCPLWIWMPFQPEKLLPHKAIVMFLGTALSESRQKCRVSAICCFSPHQTLGKPASHHCPLSPVVSLLYLAHHSSFTKPQQQRSAMKKVIPLLLLHQLHQTRGYKTHLLCDPGKQQPPGARGAECNFGCTHATSKKNMKEECSKTYVNY